MWKCGVVWQSKDIVASNVDIFFEFTDLFLLSLLFRPDEFYCWQALEKTGIYMIPGHVFDMKGSSNNFYYR